MVFEQLEAEQEPTWSREDEQNLNAALGYINDEYLRRWLKDVIHVKYDKPTWSEEDEGIRKDLTSHFKETIENIRSEEIISHDAKILVGKMQKWIAWLEKQGEQKLASKVQVSEKLYEHIRNACACIDDALSSETLADITDYLEMADKDAKSAFDMIEKQGRIAE